MTQTPGVPFVPEEYQVPNDPVASAERIVKHLAHAVVTEELRADAAVLLDMARHGIPQQMLPHTQKPLPTCKPLDSAADGTWHWLQHVLGGTWLVRKWSNNEQRWQTGNDAFGGGGASAEEIHKWGWKYVGPCTPPEVNK